MAKELQFELWQECNNQCKFCYLRNNNKHTPDKIKLNSLKNAYQTISDMSNYPEFDTISYLGGEFFQGQLNTPKIREKFMELMKKTSQLLIDGYINECWIYVTLTIGDQADLYETLKLFEPVQDKLWILTSYDTIGRFHHPKMEENWKYHMKNIHKLYPGIKFNTTTILTSDCIKKYIRDEISFQKMAEEFHTVFFFKQVGIDGEDPSTYNEKYGFDFVPTRKDFLDFLRKFKQQEPTLMWDKLFNIQYRADVLFRNGNTESQSMLKCIRHKDHRGKEIDLSWENEYETKVAPCGHLYLYHVYSDCDGCVQCDKEMLSDEQIIYFILGRYKRRMIKDD